MLSASTRSTLSLLLSACLTMCVGCSLAENLAACAQNDGKSSSLTGSLLTGRLRGGHICHQPRGWCLRLQGAGEDESEEDQEPTKKMKKKAKKGKDSKKRKVSEDEGEEEVKDADSGKENDLLPQAKTDESGSLYFELEPPNVNGKTGDTTQKRLSVTTFNDQVFVNIREFYENANKQMKPGRRGISLTVDQWNLVTHLSPQVDDKVKDMLKSQQK